MREEKGKIELAMFPQGLGVNLHSLSRCLLVKHYEGK
jgi:hypothetical protein